MTRIVVGVDGSPSSLSALRWAEHEARLHGWNLVPTLCWGYLDQHHVDGSDRFDPEYSEGDAGAALATYVERALGADAANRLDQELVCDLAAPGLLDAGEGAALLVVGSRGRGGFAGLLLGSVSDHVLQSATGPVAVVRGDVDRRSTMDRVVVGIDGSLASLEALRWAIAEARVRNATLEVVHAWPTPPPVQDPLLNALDPVVLEQAANQLVDRMLAALEISTLPTPLVRTVQQSGAAALLLERARSADMVVVGARGEGALRRLRLGSVSHQLAEHAQCPVVVLPSHDA